MKKNDKIKVLIDDMGANGEGIAHVDGITVFVPFAIQGEICLIHILKVKDNLAWAKLVGVESESLVRVEPICPYTKKCGGCALSHVKENFELELKKNNIKNCFWKNAGIKLDDVRIYDSIKNYNYRNKCAFPVRCIDGNPSVCMFKNNSHDAIKVLSCYLADENINKVIGVVNEYLKCSNESAFDEITGKGLIKFVVVRVVQEIPLITIVINGKDLKSKFKLIDLLKESFNKFGLNLNINTKNNNVILSEKFVHIFGEEKLFADESGIVYPISSLSFLQINDDIKNKIYNRVLSFFDVGDTVVDAYSGAGLLSAIIAKKVKSVYGIEIIEAATNNANELKLLNNIKNLVNINGDCAKKLPELVESLNCDSLNVVLDPPRKGCDKKVLDAIISVGVKKIVYVSCNPATLARDAKILVGGGYKLSVVEGYNMFPKTSHVETLAVFEKE